MAIRVAKSLYNQKTVADENQENDALSFNLVFTQDTEYNLDELVALHDFSNDQTPLVIEVKRDLAEKAIEEMKDSLHYTIKTSLEKQDVTNAIYEEITAVFRQYGYCYNSVTEELYLNKAHNSSIPIAAYRDLNKRINRRLNEFYNNNKLEYTLSFDNRVSGNTYKITYNYKSTDDLKLEFAYYYDQFIETYKKNLKVEQEGGLAIDAEKGKTTVSKSDFSNYLLSDDPSTSSDETDYTPGARNFHVIWEEGKEEDEREQDEIKASMYEDVEAAKDDINALKDQLLALTAKLENILNLNTVKEIDGDTEYEETLIPTVNAVIDYVNKMVTEDDYTYADQILSGDYEVVQLPDGTYKLSFRNDNIDIGIEEYTVEVGG